MAQVYRQKLLERSLRHQKGEGFKAVHQLYAKRNVDESKLRFRIGGSHIKIPPKLKIGIVGGGVSGLYAAYLLEKSYPDSFEITILEKEKEHIGGRIHTYKFSEEKYQYGEFGAMRIPDYHKKVLDLLDELKVDRIPFIFSNDDALFYLNGAKTKDGKVMTKKYANDHPEELGFMKVIIINAVSPSVPGTAIEEENFEAITLNLKPTAKKERYTTVVSIYDSVYDFLATELQKDFDGFLDTYDNYTVYSYFHELVPKWIQEDCVVLPPKAKIQGLVDSVLHYAELASSATGLNHLALVESVLDNRNFESNQNWWTVKDGMYHFPQALAGALKKTKIIKGAKVIALVNPQNDVEKVEVTWEHGLLNSKSTETFDAVLVTAPFGSVRFLDIQVPFTYGKRQAIRSLNYDHSTKIFAQFPTRWWEKINKLQGGASSTDLPVHTVVYPSYGLNDEGKGVLLTSYTWQNDAILWANADKHTLKETVLSNLGVLHNTKFHASDVEIAVHTWLEAFALFGPGQFQLMINAMIPEFGVHFAGEHLSTFHAWILGALHSATRAVREILVLEGVLSVDDSWTKFPDDEFTADSWRDYMSNVKPPKK